VVALDVGFEAVVVGHLEILPKTGAVNSEAASLHGLLLSIPFLHISPA
jgi:hypothetical protein